MSSVLTVYRPEIGERVLVVPQTWFHLMSVVHRGSMIGQPPDMLEKFPAQHRFPFWAEYTAGMPGWGYGLMVVREGKLALGPSDWDTSG